MSPVRPFLTARWRHLAMLNYVVDPRILAPLVPPGTEIDYENGETFVSVVGFLFLDTRLLGLPIPLHRDFEEVNLRFYVRKKSADTWRRGVVFIREMVPRRAIALGLSISFTGIITFKRSHELRAIAQSLPADRILIETDAPYLAPGRYRGKRNEPAYVVETAKVLAEVRGVSLETIARQTSENFFRLFRKVPPQAGDAGTLRRSA